MFHRFQNSRAWTGAIALGLTLIFTVTACSAGSSKIEACKLVSATAAGRILGTRVTVKAVDTAVAGSDVATICNYNTGSVHGGFMLIAGRIHYTDAAAEVAYQEKTATTDIPPGTGKLTFSFTAVKGLGEAAYLAKMRGSFQLHVLAHGMAIVIAMDASPKAVARSKQLARIALGNIK